MMVGIKDIRNDTGAVQVIEMTLVFPIVIIAMGFLIYISFYILQGVSMYNNAQRIAVTAAREAAFPGYEKLYGNQGVTVKADFAWEDGYSPAIDLLNDIMKEHDPYRYMGNGFLNESEKSSLESNLEKLIKSGSFLADSFVECHIKTENNILSQEVQVNVKKQISSPGFLQYLGIDDDLSININAKAVVNDPAEFIRNTDMVFDFKDYVFDNLKIGKSGQTINERISIFKQKFSDAGARLGLSW